VRLNLVKPWVSQPAPAPASRHGSG